MRRARAFFVVCAGVFLLVLAYHLGAQSARAQGQVLEAPSCDHGNYMASVNRVLWFLDALGLRQAGAPIPGTSPVVAASGGGLPGAFGGYAVLANGDCYYLPSGGDAWQLYGNLLGGGPTPVQGMSWGLLKARYATSASTKPRR